MKVLDTVEFIRERMQELEVLSDYYDELSKNVSEESLGMAKDKMKHVRKDILKKTFEVKNLLKRLELAEKSGRKKGK